MSNNIKRESGRYFTRQNPFNNQGFYDWAAKAKIKEKIILEPFAGENSLIKMLKNMGLCTASLSYDINPDDSEVQYRDTLSNFPEGFDICITNPPYLAKNSAKRRGLTFPDTFHDDLYKLSLEKCLKYCEYVAAIIPASFLNANIFRDRLSQYILLNNTMFSDTEHPVCLALFEGRSQDVKIYEGSEYIGWLSSLAKKIPRKQQGVPIRFNDKDGELGLLAIDNTEEASIQFVKGEEINANKIKVSSRSITRIKVEGYTEQRLKELNERLKCFRSETHDLFLTPFKGLRKDKKYRRRLDFALARNIIEEVYACL